MSINKKITKIIGLAALTTYLVGITNSTIKLNKELKPLRDTFKDWAKNKPAKIIKIETMDGTKKVYDYGGALDYLIEKRNYYLKKVPGPQIPFDWYVHDWKKPGNCYVINLNPIPKIPSFYEEKNDFCEIIKNIYEK